MSYGPQLPAHLQKKHQASESESEEDESYGPKLPSVSCRGPEPSNIGPQISSGPTNIGPQRPLGPKVPSSESESDEESYGPKLPSVPCRAPQPSSIGPQIPANIGSQRPSASSSIGPTMPPNFGTNIPDTDSSSDDDMIGPRPPKPGEELSAEDAMKRSIEARAQKMQDRLEGRDQAAEPKRESWMTELPENKAKNFGLGPRTFSKSTNPKTKQDKSWTQTPNDKASGEKEDTSNPEQDEEVLAYMASLQRDAQMDKISEQLNKKRGTDSLMDLHTKKLKKKEKKDKKKDKPQERRPFDRDVDLQANRFDDARKKAMIKKTAGLEGKFGSGSSKYL